MIEIQNASADTKRFDKRLKSKAWETVAYAETYQEALESLIEGLNNEAINIEDGWLRIVDTETKQVFCY